MAKQELLSVFYDDIPAKSLSLSASALAEVYEGIGKVIVFPTL